MMFLLKIIRKQKSNNKTDLVLYINRVHHSIGLKHSKPFLASSMGLISSSVQTGILAIFCI